MGRLGSGTLRREEKRHVQLPRNGLISGYLALVLSITKGWVNLLGCGQLHFELVGPSEVLDSQRAHKAEEPASTLSCSFTHPHPEVTQHLGSKTPGKIGAVQVNWKAL